MNSDYIKTFLYILRKYKNYNKIKSIVEKQPNDINYLEDTFNNIHLINID